MSEQCDDIFEDYKVGIDLVDEEHEVLFGLADTLLRTLESNDADRDVALMQLDALYQYAASHFAHEETIMRNINYPALFTHKAQHTQLKEEFATIQETFRQTGDQEVWKGMATILRHWVQRHVKSSDVQLRDYIHAGVCVQKDATDEDAD